MQEVTVKQIILSGDSLLEQSITLAGWVRTVRESKDFGFIELNDGSFFKNVQIVFESKLPNFSEVSKLGVGSAIIVKGCLVPSPGANQSFEVKADEIMVQRVVIHRTAIPDEFIATSLRNEFI